MSNEDEIKTGTKFTMVGRKNKSVWTVKDIWITKNLKGDIVKTRYVASHTFLGQEVFDYDVLGTTIKRGFLKEGELK